MAESIQGSLSANGIPLANRDRPQTSDCEGRGDMTADDCDPDYLRTPEQLIEDFKEDAAKKYSEKERAEAFTYVANVVKTHSEEMIQRWNKEIDALLTYAGLFSAVLTAFNVESYQLLKPDSTDETTAILLQISAQLGSLSVASPFINSTLPSYERAAISSPGTPRYAVWLNALWFSSLICSLASASVGIMVKQWISEYSSGLSGNSPEIARLRQYRFNSLRKWHVPIIVAMLPLLLQTALFLFLVGVVLLLWSLNTSVAAVALILVGTLLVFTLLTVILPSVRDDCCYLSPQSVAFFHLFEWTRWCTRQLGILVAMNVRWTLVRCWSLYRLFDDLGHPVASWIYRHCNIMISGISRWEDALRSGLPPLRPWWEHVLVVQRSASPDVDIMTTAFTITMDPETLRIIAPLLLGLSGTEILRCHRRVCSVLTSHWGPEFQWPGTARAPYFEYNTRLVESALAANLETTSDPCQKGLVSLFRSLEQPQLLVQANLEALTRVVSIVTMSPPYLPAGQATHWLLCALRHAEDRPNAVNFPAVASAVAFGLGIFERDRPEDVDEATCEYTDTLEVAFLCVAREMADPSSKDALAARATYIVSS
ncbi:hypothetical protein OH76DRAFT_917327 [Lentinus brumalis]|uniref:DUF6535 domain-containing protein n=1 Tax=Lentinus brumalis TaxID=2498619 RepID=A0A371D0G1_9APHY|nr:hypothetical protein OH76DRAFT_917327 [Polyporus brumalis]